MAKVELDIVWEGKRLKTDEKPVYLGITLDRTLSFREHVTKLRKKLSSRNSLLGCLASSSWGAEPKTLRSTALALVYSTAEYCSPVWSRSCHASGVDVELNRACRTVTGNLKCTPLTSLYRIAGIAPPPVRRETQAKTERDKQLNDSRYPLYGHQEVHRRLRSRNSFSTVTGLGNDRPSAYKLRRWREMERENNKQSLPPPAEQIPAGSDLNRKLWVTLNRARAKVGKTADNLHRWGHAASSACPCGEAVQTIEHLLTTCPLGPTCSDGDLRDATDTARHWIRSWSDTL